MAAAVGAGGLAWLLGRGERRGPILDPRVVARIPGRIVGPRVATGHLLRETRPPWLGQSPVDRRRVRTAIVGGGIAGLSAAWAFDRAGWDDYVLLELEPRVGGTSGWYDYPTSACPLGAHYIPLPTTESRGVRRLLEDLGVIHGYQPDGTPRYEETFLCQAPQERLFAAGTWQEGLWPSSVARAADNVQLDAFHGEMERWRERRGRDGRPAFTIPIASASRDSEILALDCVSMADYLVRKGWTSKLLRWYVEYATRDDYGCTIENTSAWAGIHYFASRGRGTRKRDRSGKVIRQVDSDDVLTWPDGNGWLARGIRERVGARRIVANALVFHVEPGPSDVTVDWWDGGRIHRIACDGVVLAVPRFVATRLCGRYKAARGGSIGAFSYAPWIVSNIVVDRLPQNGAGAPVAWDNVLYGSDSLGYVVATHQSLATVDRGSVLTHYQPLVHGEPQSRRSWALRQPWEAWRDNALRDLAVAHPDIAETVQQLDVTVWGHAMVRPTPRFMWGPQREAAGIGIERVWPAHTDMSGIAIFEEAHYHGVAAAQAVMRSAGHRFEDVL